MQRDLKRDQLQLQRQETQLESEIKRAARQGNNNLARSLAKVNLLTLIITFIFVTAPFDTFFLIATHTSSQPKDKEPKGRVSDFGHVSSDHCHAEQHCNGVSVGYWTIVNRMTTDYQLSQQCHEWGYQGNGGN